MIVDKNRPLVSTLRMATHVNVTRLFFATSYSYYLTHCITLYGRKHDYFEPVLWLFLLSTSKVLLLAIRDLRIRSSWLRRLSTAGDGCSLFSVDIATALPPSGRRKKSEKPFSAGRYGIGVPFAHILQQTFAGRPMRNLLLEDFSQPTSSVYRTCSVPWWLSRATSRNNTLPQNVSHFYIYFSRTTVNKGLLFILFPVHFCCSCI